MIALTGTGTLVTYWLRSYIGGDSDYATAREGQRDRGEKPDFQLVEDIEEKWVLFRQK